MDFPLLLPPDCATMACAAAIVLAALGFGLVFFVPPPLLFCSASLYAADKTYCSPFFTYVLFGQFTIIPATKPSNKPSWQ